MNEITEITWKKSADVIERTIDGEKVLLSLKSGVYYSLNETGSMIWDMLENPTTVEKITRGLLEVFEGDENTVMESVSDLMGELAAEDLSTGEPIS